MSWVGRVPVPLWIRLGAVVAACAASTLAALWRPEAILSWLVTAPAAWLFTRARVAEISLDAGIIMLQWSGQQRRIDVTAASTTATLCRWTPQPASMVGLAIRLRPEHGPPLVVGTRGNALPVMAGQVATCKRSDVILPARAFVEFSRALCGGSSDDAQVVGALAASGRLAVFDLWPNGRFPCAFLGVALAAPSLYLLARFLFGLAGPAFFPAGGGYLSYLFAVLLAGGALQDARTMWRRGNVALRLTVRDRELVVQRPDSGVIVARSSLESLVLTKGVWRATMTDMAESNENRLLALGIVLGPTYSLTIGTTVEGWHPAVLPKNLQAARAAAARSSRMKAPRYLALPEDWPELVRILTPRSR